MKKTTIRLLVLSLAAVMLFAVLNLESANAGCYEDCYEAGGFLYSMVAKIKMRPDDQLKTSNHIICIEWEDGCTVKYCNLDEDEYDITPILPCQAYKYRRLWYTIYFPNSIQWDYRATIHVNFNGDHGYGYFNDSAHNVGSVLWTEIVGGL